MIITTKFNYIAQHKLQDIISSAPHMPNSHLIKRIDSLAKSYSIPKTKIPIFSPANTAHPTNIFDRNYEIHKHKGILHNHHQVMPHENLSVNEEVARKIFYLDSIMKSIPKIMHNLGIENYHEYSNLLDLHSWAGCDADGNINITHLTMKDALKQSQDCMISFIQNLVSDLLKSPKSELRNIADRMQNTINALNKQKSEDGTINQCHIRSAEDTLIGLINTVDIKKNPELQHLIFTINNIGLSGYKLDVRQSSKVIDICAKDMLEIIAEHSTNVDSEIKQYLEECNIAIQNKENIPQISDELISNLMNSPENIQIILKNKNKLSKVSQLELNRMLLVQEHPDVFKTFRISDARNYKDVAFMRFMEKLAQIEQNKLPSKNTDFVMLTETEEDIKNLFDNTKQIVEKNLFSNNRIQIFVGYSDAQKRMGLSGELIISESVCKIKLWLDNHNKILTSQGLEPIDIIINHGGGSDIMRGAKYHAHGTYQGIDANYLSNPDNLQHILATAIFDSNYSSLDRQIQQYQEVSADKDLSKTLNKFLQLGMRDYRTLFAYKPEQIKVHDLKPINVNNPKGVVTADLIEKIMPAPLVQTSNTSSRAASKGKTKKLHLDEARAIGLSAQISATGTGLQVFSGLPSVHDFNQEDINNLKKIFDKMDVFQDIMYKALFEALKFDPNRANMMLEAQNIIPTDEEKSILLKNELKINHLMQLLLQVIPFDRLAGIDNSIIQNHLSKFIDIEKLQNKNKLNEVNEYYGKDIHKATNNFMNIVAKKLSNNINNNINSNEDLQKHGLLNIAKHAELIQTGIQPYLDDALKLYALEKYHGEEPTKEHTQYAVIGIKGEQIVPDYIRNSYTKF